MRLGTLAALLGGVLALTSPVPASANGWEHGAVPFDVLLKALHFDDAAMRRQAARSLGIRQQKAAVEPLLQLLARESDPGVRTETFAALGRLGDAAAIPALETCVDGGEPDDTRAVCVASLGFIGGGEAFRLVREATDDTAFLVRNRAVEALGRFSDPASVRILERFVTGDNASLKWRSLNALAATAHPAAAPVLLAALESAPDDETRLAAIKGLGKSGNSVALGTLRNVIEETENPVLRTAAVIAVGSIESGDRIGALADFLQDDLPSVRFVALRALRDLGDRRAVPAILERATGNSRILTNLDADAMRAEPLETMGVISEQMLAVQTLTDLQPEAAVDVFLAAARMPDLSISSGTDAKLAVALFLLKRAAIYGLGYTKSEQAWSHLVGAEALGHPDFRIRATSVRSLGVLEMAGTEAYLLPRLEDSNAEVRWEVCSVLGRIGGPASGPALQATLRDSHSHVRKEAALGLGYLKFAAAKPDLSELAESDESRLVRQSAALALSLLE